MDKIFTPLLYHRNLRISLIDSLFIQSIFFLFTQDWFTLRNVLVRSSGTFVPRLPRKFHERERDLKLRIIHERYCKEKETTVINVTTLFHTAFFHPAQNCKHNPPPHTQRNLHHGEIARITWNRPVIPGRLFQYREERIIEPWLPLPNLRYWLYEILIEQYRMKTSHRRAFSRVLVKHSSVGWNSCTFVARARI